MIKYLFLFASIYSSLFSSAQCSYCTSIETALITPNKVRVLDLHAQGLMSFPDSIENFVNLEELNLSQNFISDFDVPNLKIGSLKKLNLSNNPAFNGMVLNEIANTFPSLVELDLSSCNMRYISPDISKFDKLQKLNLSHNDLDYIPEELGSIQSLNTLDLSNNQLKDLFFLREVWGITMLNTAGNPGLTMREVGSVLLFKNSVRQVVMSSRSSDEKIPNEFSEVAVEELVLIGQYFGRPNYKITRNDSIKRIVLDGIEVLNGPQFVTWINSFSGLESLEFRNTVVPRGIKDIRVDKLIFTNSEIEVLGELKHIHPKVQIKAVNTNIKDGNHIGNAKISSSVQSSVELVTPLVPTEEMLENRVVPIVTIQPQSFQITSSESSWIEMKESNYKIPENAFLKQDGSIYDGQVKIEITEYMDPIINALAGMPMIYNDNGTNEIFASNGMIEFRAYDDAGEELKANPENQIEVELRDVQPGTPANLFQFNQDSSSWAQIGTPRSSNFDDLYGRYMDSLNKIPDEQIVNFNVLQRPIFLSYKKSRLDPYILDFSTTSGNRDLRKIEKGVSTIYTGNLDQKWICSKVNWILDTTINEQIKDHLLDIKKTQKRASAYWNRKRASDYYYAPRLIKELKISPNFENDNYTLSFRYKDSTINYPVYPTFGGSVRKVQEKEKKNFKDYERQLKKSQYENELIVKHREKNLKLMAMIERDRRAQALVNAEMFRLNQLLSPNNYQSNLMLENNRFGLSSFGLMNCDYFSRNSPDNYIAVDSLANDQNGDWVRMPATIRNIYLDDNSYVTTSSEYAPQYNNRKSIAFIVISAIEIAVIKGWELLSNGKFFAKIERLNIEGDSPEQVRSKILNLE